MSFYKAKRIEDYFFYKRDREITEQYRELQKAKLDKQALSAASGIIDDRVLEKFLQLKIRPETLAALAVVPLVAVAWADGEVDEKEKMHILEAVVKFGWAKGSADYILLERWLAHKPEAVLMEVWAEYMKDLCVRLMPYERADYKKELMAHVTAIAGTSGGILGIGAVSKEEKRVITAIENGFNVSDRMWHAMEQDAVLKSLKTVSEGLGKVEADNRLRSFGENIIVGKKPRPVYAIFFSQFLSPLVYILLAAAGVKFIFSSAVDGAVIMCVLFLMAAIGTFQEFKAASAVQALLSLVSPKAKVRRAGTVLELNARQIVPGDMVILEAGDKVPADIRILIASGLRANESSLTGESVPVEKFPSVIEENSGLSERKNMLYTGTAVVSGRSEGVVVTTGMKTQVGMIAQAIKDTKPELTPLQKGIHVLGNYIIIFAGAGCVLLVGSGLARSMSLKDIFLLTVAASVSAIPEGLPGVITVLLSKGMQVMAKSKAIVRRMTAVETLGSCTVICTDKTGTLTKNEMTVKELVLANGSLAVSGEGYTPTGAFSTKNGAAKPGSQTQNILMRASILCNDAVYDPESKTIIGDPTEGALLVTAHKAGLKADAVRKEFPRFDGIPFSSEKQYMSSMHSIDGKDVLFIKGSPEKIIAFSSGYYEDGRTIVFDDTKREHFVKENARMAGSSLRVIAFAFRECSGVTCVQPKDAEHGLTLIGLAGMMDPPRAEAVQAILSAGRAGIGVTMITGDNGATASAIARMLGMENKSSLSGSELRSMNDETLAATINSVNVFYRVEPLDKLKIVRAYQSRGEIVAMTGDGVNDAPALEAADIGVSMGITGTDVAKEASDIVLNDDNFATILKAVEEGRAIFTRLRNVVYFLLSTCFGELLSLIAAVSFIGVAPLLPLQILWVNLVTGTLLAIPIGFEPKTGTELLHAPRNPKVGLLFHGMLVRIAITSLFIAVGVVLNFWIVLQFAGLEKARAVAFCTIVVIEWLVAFNARSDSKTVFSLGFLRNKSLIYAALVAVVLQLSVIYFSSFQMVLKTVSLSLSGWIIVVIPALVIFFAESLRKKLSPEMFGAGKWQPLKSER